MIAHSGNKHLTSVLLRRLISSELSAPELLPLPGSNISTSGVRQRKTSCRRGYDNLLKVFYDVFSTAYFSPFTAESLMRPLPHTISPPRKGEKEKSVNVKPSLALGLTFWCVLANGVPRDLVSTFTTFPP